MPKDRKKTKKNAKGTLQNVPLLPHFLAPSSFLPYFLLNLRFVDAVSLYYLLTFIDFDSDFFLQSAKENRCQLQQPFDPTPKKKKNLQKRKEKPRKK